MTDVLRSPWLWAFVVGCALVTLMRPLLRREPPPPPVLRELPVFELVDSAGAPFGSESLRGHVYVASFFFTRCPSVCPAMLKSMARLQKHYDEMGFDSIRLVSITVDPDFDTPERLREAEALYGVDRARWRLLTGPREQIRDLAVNGFGVAVGDPPPAAADPFDIAHGAKLMLVDPKGRLRGYYGYGDEGLDEVYWRSRHVLDEARRG